jgi:hypothetical protein
LYSIMASKLFATIFIICGSINNLLFLLTIKIL